MAYGNLLADVVQGSTSSTPPVFRDGSGVEIGRLCRAWVNFDGTSGASIRSSFNVSSVTYIATGKYTINFSTAMPDANYCGVMFNNATTGTPSINAFSNQWTGGMEYTASSLGVSSYYTGFSDSSLFCVAIFR